MSGKNSEIFGSNDAEAAEGLGQRAASGGLTAVGFQGVRMLLQFASLAVYARLLLPEDFGIVVMATTVTAFVGMFSDLGLGAATIQRKTIDQNLVSALWLTNCVLGLAVMLICFALAPAAAHIYDTPEVAAVVFASALAYPMTASAAQHQALLARRMQWMQLQSIPVIATFCGLCTGMVLAWQTDLGYWALVIGNLVTPAIQCLFFWFSSPFRPTFVKNWDGVRSSISFGLYLTGFNFLTYFHRTLDNVLIGAYSNANAVGHYSRAYSVFMLPLTLVSGPVSTAMIPAMSRAVDDKKLWSALYLGAVSILTVISAPAALILTFHAHGVVDILYGPGWTRAANILSLLGPAMLVHPLFASAQWLFVSRGETKKMFWASVPAIGTFVISYIFGIADGAEGVAWMYAWSSFVVVPIWLVYAAYIAKLPIAQLGLAIGIPAAMAAIAFGAVELMLADVSWMYRIVLFGFAYAASIASLLTASSTLREKIRLLAR